MAAFVAGIFMNDFVEFRLDTRATSKTRLNDFDGTTKAFLLGKPQLDQRISMRGSLLEFQIAAREISYNRR
ncbi:hypothetical protein LOF17_08630 [Sinorhizobium meliloti]|nr:hypothetical protein [Sinorhizobium meliloti]AEG56172.1 hypothetical protein Sinme_4496 [Sinorhizobium meliloti AK83]MDE4587844.1 hypothetical protein [Sinorhizobium meliloti]UIJ92162.1 hypothetical protein LZK74_12550 [Sinorhizobium meliloti]WKL24804.1 hypothetical protein Q1M63_13500 [Sinorhizobium meliloti]WKL28815.1 hypothetical protein Q1M65_11600 [Sinorhizobium meliloti]